MGAPLGLFPRHPRQDLPASEHSIITAFFGEVQYICKVYEVGELAGQAYIVMQYIDGTPLDTAVASSSLSMMDKLVLIQKVAIAIHEAHKLGIIHRDAHSEIPVEKPH